MADGKLSDKVPKKVDGFTELEDTPDTYVGNAGKILKVTSDETGLEFEGTSRSYIIQGQGTPPVPLAGSQLLSQRLPITDSTTFSNLKDTSVYTGQSGKTVLVNANENGLTYGNESNYNSATLSVSTSSVGTNAWVDGVENAPSLGFWGFVLLPNNKVYMVPYYHASKTCIFNPETNGFEDTVSAAPGPAAFAGGVLMGNGKVILAPSNYAGKNILYNPATNDYENTTTAFTGGAGGCVLLPNGKVLMIPDNNTSTKLLYNPDTNDFEDVGGSISGRFMGGCLLPNGKVFMSPNGYTGSTMIYNPETNNFENALSNSSGNNFYSAVLLPNGKVFCPPYNSVSGENGKKLIYNPETNDFEKISGSRPSNVGFGGGVLMTNGKVLLAVFSSNATQIYNPDTNELEEVSVVSPMGPQGELGIISLADGRCFALGYGYSGKQYIFEPEGMGDIPYGDWMLEPYFNKF